jgi:urea transport system substrate-binding protein
MVRKTASALGKRLVWLLLLGIVAISIVPAVSAQDDNTIKVGLLHSLSGTMSISETTVRDSELMAIDEINAAGGVLGKQIVPVVEDGASDWPTFAEKARKLIQEDNVAVIFGCWTSASRKAVLPVVEQLDGLLFYPVQYEGLEESPNIVYTGATTNQQIVPAVQYLLDQGKKKFFLLGSDYVFPRTSNTIIRAQLGASGGTVAGEEYVPLGGTEFTSIISEIQAAQPDVIFNTLNGDSNVAFFKQFTDAGYTADTLPVLSVSIAEEEVKSMGVENITGQLTAWNYYETVDTPENTKFVAAFKAKYGADRVTSDPMEAGYFGVYLWKEAVEKANSFKVDDVRAAIHAGGISYAAPEGTVSLDGPTQHTVKPVRIGKIREDGLIDTVFATDPVTPDPYLCGYPWATVLTRPDGVCSTTMSTAEATISMTPEMTPGS